VKLSFLRYRGASAKLQHDRAKAVDIVVAQKFSRTTRPLLGERDRMALHGAATELRRPRVRSIAGELEGAERARAPAARSAPDSPSTGRSADGLVRGHGDERSTADGVVGPKARVTLALRWNSALVICSARTGPPCVFLRKSSGQFPTPA